MSRQNLGEHPLPRLRDRIVAAVRVGHRHVFFAAKVARHVENRALALVLHDRTKLTDQRVIGDQIRLHGAVPVRQRHVDDHFFGPRDAGIVDQEIHIAEQLHRTLIQRVQRGRVTDIDIRHGGDAGFRVRVTNAAQFLDDFVTRFL